MSLRCPQGAPMSPGHPHIPEASPRCPRVPSVSPRCPRGVPTVSPCPPAVPVSPRYPHAPIAVPVSPRHPHVPTVSPRPPAVPVSPRCPQDVPTLSCRVQPRYLRWPSVRKEAGKLHIHVPSSSMHSARTSGTTSLGGGQRLGDSATGTAPRGQHLGDIATGTPRPRHARSPQGHPRDPRVLVTTSWSRSPTSPGDVLRGEPNLVPSQFQTGPSSKPLLVTFSEENPTWFRPSSNLVPGPNWSQSPTPPGDVLQGEPNLVPSQFQTGPRSQPQLVTFSKENST